MSLRSLWPETVSSSRDTVKSHFGFHTLSLRLSLLCSMSKHAKNKEDEDKEPSQFEKIKGLRDLLEATVS